MPVDTSYVEGQDMPKASDSVGDNCRTFRAASVSATDSNEGDSSEVHSIDTYSYSKEWVPTRAARVVVGGQSKTEDPGTK
jgi:hypothetical protein